jgi:UDP-N-acetylglucosamine 2-epimerase (non-hydrolysing)
MKKVLLVFGTRPEAIKMCPVVQALERLEDMEPVVCVTGQHRQMLGQVLDCFGITPRYDLAVMEPGQSLTDMTGRILQGVEKVCRLEEPDILLVQGDTTTAFAGALAGFYNGVPIGHVEAGLRTYNNQAPYPEEFNRQAVGAMARLHFAPTQEAKENLLREGKHPDTVFVTGNTSIDALKTTVRPDYHHPELTWAQNSRLVLLTAHRRENWGEPLRHIFRAVKRVAAEHPEVKVLYPVHSNPDIQALARAELGGQAQVHLTEPLDVVDFHNLLSRVDMVLTDSGGVQEEAPALGKPVLVLRDTTERPEGVRSGALELVGTQEQAVYEAFCRLLDDDREYARRAQAVNPYGDGTASTKIADILRQKQP